VKCYLLMRSAEMLTAAAAVTARTQSPGRAVETSVCTILWDTCASRERGVEVVPSMIPPQPAYRSQHHAAAVARRSADSPHLSLPTSTAESPVLRTVDSGIAEFAGLEIAGLEIDRQHRRGGHCRTMEFDGLEFEGLQRTAN